MVLQKCHSGVTVVLRLCYSEVLLVMGDLETIDLLRWVLRWFYSGVTMVLQKCHSGVTVVLRLCYSEVLLVMGDLETVDLLRGG
jgi:hypothetical protein